MKQHPHHGYEVRLNGINANIFPLVIHCDASHWCPFVHPYISHRNIWSHFPLLLSLRLLVVWLLFLYGLGPSYLKDCLHKYVPECLLRSSSADLLDVPTMTYKKYGKRAFCFYGSTIWNELPQYIRRAVLVDTFKAQLKTYLYTLAFGWFLNIRHVLIWIFDYYCCSVFCFLFFDWLLIMCKTVF